METIPALKSGLSFLGGSVAGEQTTLERVPTKSGFTFLAQSESSLKLGTFKPTINTPAPSQPTTPGTTEQPPSVEITPSKSTTSLQCENRDNIPFELLTKVTLNIPNLGNLTMYELNTSRNPETPQHTFYFKSASFPVQSIDEVRDAFFKAVEEQYVINVSRYLKTQQPTVLGKLTSVDSVKDIFIQMWEGKSCLENEIALQAPFLFCLQGLSSNFGYDLKRVEQVDNNVTHKILEIVQSNQILSYSEQPDIFPQSSLINFQWVFVNPYTNSSRRGYQLKENYDRSCYISGQSPSLYLYPEKEMEVKVSLGGPISYSYPSLSNNTWSVVAKPDGTLFPVIPSESRFNRESRGISHTPTLLSEIPLRQLTDRNDTGVNRLYYEYDKSQVSFTEPKEGFVVKSNEWEEFIRDTLAPQLGLTKIEEDDLVVDVRNALSDTKVAPYVKVPPFNEYLKISFVDRKELDENLLVSISPKPDTFHRIHLLLTPLTDNPSISNPSLQKLARDGFTAVEVGASLGEYPNP